MKKLLIIPAVSLMLAGCGAKATQNEYEITVDNLPLAEGDLVYLTDFDTQATMDSVVVEGGVARFKGVVDKPFVGRLLSGGKRLGQVIVEPGVITLREGVATGTELNDRYNELGKEVEKVVTDYNAAPTDSVRALVLERYEQLTDSMMRANADNVIGYMLFVERSSEMTPDEAKAALEAMPELKGYTRVKHAMAVFDAKAATSAGKKFTDLAIEHDGATQHLSDYVGQGRYTLVDFWASWCGPCRRESKVIKDLYKEYGPKGLDVVGVAVWDEPEASIAAAEQLGMTWPQIVGGTTEHTDVYGILGIPCIMLIAPDGTIVARDLMGDELREAVANAMK